jgi:hypothetical protein
MLQIAYNYLISGFRRDIDDFCVLLDIPEERRSQNIIPLAVQRELCFYLL